jgi:hypothetical protein
MPNANSHLEVLGHDIRPETLRDVQAPILDGTPLDPSAVVTRAKGVSEVIDKLSNYALTLTEPRHWTGYREKDGKIHPWLTGPGSEMMISKLSLHVDFEGSGYSCDRFEFPLPGGGVSVQLLMTCRLRISLGAWSSIVVEGHCSTADAFFSRGGNLAAHAVDLGNIRQAAYTNALANGVTRLLGIRRLSMEDVKRITNGKVHEENIESADFRKGGKGGVSKGTEALCTNEQRNAVWKAWCDGMGIDTKALPAGIADTFYAWVVRWLGPEKKDKLKWTEADAKKLVQEAGALKEPQAPDLPSEAP